MSNITNEQENKIEMEIEVPAEDTANKTDDVVMPFEYAEDEHYYVDDLGTIKKKPFYSFMKRAFDIFVSIFGLIFCALPMLIIAIAIKCSSKGPVFYAQERLGLNGKKFMLVKFRTMVADAEKQGAQWSQGDSDSRITKVGSILRKTRLDELPQLWTCFTGKLSLIGPRPEREIFYNKFEEHVHGFSERLKVKPGLTGLAQVSGGYDLRPEEKVVHDIEYIKNRSIGLEIKILFKTVKVIFTHDGAK
jgi:lipopolysaccharide/colanic/teichoic acid biosynthesis glycosyltransferase